MTRTQHWREVDSKIHCPGRWLAVVIGLVFLVIGAAGFLMIGRITPPNMPSWIGKTATALFAALGALAFVGGIYSMLFPRHVRHAAPEVLSDVPSEPIPREGSVLRSRLPHELTEDSHGWWLNPRQRLWAHDRRFLLGFGVPFLSGCAALLSWEFHRELQFGGWPLAIAGAVFVTLLSGGSAFVLIGMLMRAGPRHLCRLSIPHQGANLELDLPEEPDPDMDLAAGFKWAVLGETQRVHVTIPVESVRAVQLCPWKLISSGSTTWGVQGLLVLARPEVADYHRVPVLLTANFVGAARLMRQLADILQVPYLFCASSEGWKAEAQRAKSRPPLRVSGGLP